MSLVARLMCGGDSFDEVCDSLTQDRHFLPMPRAHSEGQVEGSPSAYSTGCCSTVAAWIIGMACFHTLVLCLEEVCQ